MYQNNNSYNNHHNPYGGNHNSDFEKQRRQMELQEQKKYKFEAEKSMDSIVQSYLSAQRNSNDFYIDEADKSAINRYYNRYWSNKFVAISIFILCASFISAFYSNLAIFGILAVLVFFNLYSQSAYFQYFGNDIKLKSKNEDILKDLIFPNQLNSKTIVFLAIGMTLISYIVSFFTKPIFLIENDPSIVIKILHYFKINFQNELFAYSVATSILILIFLKIYEKWSK